MFAVADICRDMKKTHNLLTKSNAPIIVSIHYCAHAYNFLTLILLIFVRVWSKLMIELGIKPSVYSALQVSCQGEIGNRQLEMSLCKLLPFVLVGLTELNS